MTDQATIVPPAVESTEATARKLLTPRLRERVELRVREVLDMAAKIWPEHAARFQDAPTIRYDVKNRYGGFAISGGPDDWTIRLNLILCYENEEHFVKQTVGHEVAHLITRVVHGSTKKVEEKGQTVIKKIRSHGAEWRSVMVEIGLKPDTYHTYDTSSIETKKRKRAPRGAKLTGLQTLDMLKRLQTGFRRLDDEAKREFMSWAQDRLDGVEEGDE